MERFQSVAKSFAPNTGFEAVCARSGLTVQVPPDESLLDALSYAGHRVATGCGEGVCGSCELTVFDGEPEHRDDIGAPAGRCTPVCPARCHPGSSWTSESEPGPLPVSSGPASVPNSGPTDR
ncbi:2Fe-2S iron-sulfur cluster-binding protein [Streptomyces iconiensis]|uniref:2Fe-2S iron-sulfur cluster-binding protein n=1 Tax=Streptomyces iconiensis TaxID=1384038 RepID=UPI003D2F557A